VLNVLVWQSPRGEVPKCPGRRLQLAHRGRGDLHLPVTTAVLMQTGVDSFSAVQSYLTDSFWSELDPTGADEEIWNRYAHLDWRLADTGRTSQRLLSVDAIAIEMDPCSDFAQRRVDCVLTPVADNASSPCLSPVRTIDTDSIDLQILRIVPPAASAD
jgi:hypothetical protein